MADGGRGKEDPARHEKKRKQGRGVRRVRSGENAGSSEEGHLLSGGSGSKENVGSSAGSAPSRASTRDVFAQLRRRHGAAAQAADVAFSAQQKSERVMVVLLVAALYVFFYVAGGLAYYLLDMYGYTIDYSNRANVSDATSRGAGGGGRSNRHRFPALP